MQQVLDVSPPLAGDALKITFEAVHGKSETGGVCLSELKLAGPKDPFAAFPGLRQRIDEALSFLGDDQRHARGRRALLAIGPPALPQTLAAHGIPYQQFPMAPDGLPDEGFEQRWALVSPELREMLRAGAKLLVHCSDGMLRSGMVAGRLLIELGCRPEDALNRVQAARAGALTMPQQRDYLLHRVHVPRADATAPGLHPEIAQALGAAPGSAAVHLVETLAAESKAATTWRGQPQSSAPIDLAKYRQGR